MLPHGRAGKTHLGVTNALLVDGAELRHFGSQGAALVGVQAPSPRRTARAIKIRAGNARKPSRVGQQSRWVFGRIGMGYGANFAPRGGKLNKGRVLLGNWRRGPQSRRTSRLPLEFQISLRNQFGGLFHSSQSLNIFFNQTSDSSARHGARSITSVPSSKDDLLPIYRL